MEPDHNMIRSSLLPFSKDYRRCLDSTHNVLEDHYLDFIPRWLPYLVCARSVFRLDRWPENLYYRWYFKTRRWCGLFLLVHGTLLVLWRAGSFWWHFGFIFILSVASSIAYLQAVGAHIMNYCLFLLLDHYLGYPQNLLPGPSCEAFSPAGCFLHATCFLFSLSLSLGEFIWISIESGGFRGPGSGFRGFVYTSDHNRRTKSPFKICHPFLFLHGHIPTWSTPTWRLYC